MWSGFWLRPFRACLSAACLHSQACWLCTTQRNCQKLNPPTLTGRMKNCVKIIGVLKNFCPLERLLLFPLCFYSFSIYIFFSFALWKFKLKHSMENFFSLCMCGNPAIDSWVVGRWAQCRDRVKTCKGFRRGIRSIHIIYLNINILSSYCLCVMYAYTIHTYLRLLSPAFESIVEYSFHPSLDCDMPATAHTWEYHSM